MAALPNIGGALCSMLALRPLRLGEEKKKKKERNRTKI